MQKTAISVSQLNLFVKSLLDADARLADIFISGEISNFSGHYRSGHLYFTLNSHFVYLAFLILYIMFIIKRNNYLYFTQINP